MSPLEIIGMTAIALLLLAALAGLIALPSIQLREIGKYL